MLSHLKSLGKDTLVYGIASVLMNMVPALTLPIYARAFRPATYGILDLAVVSYGLLLQVMDLGLISGFTRIYFDRSDEQEDARVLVVSSAFWVAFGVSIFTCLAFELFATAIAGAIFGRSSHADLVRILGLTFPVGMAATFLRSVMRVRFQKWQYVGSAVGAATCAAVVGVVSVVGFGAGVAGVLVGQLIGFTCAAAYGACTQWGRIRLRVSVTDLRAMFAFGLPLIPTAAAFGIVSLIDRYMVERLSTLDQLGQYAVANRVTQLLPLVVLGFTTAYSPWLFRLWSTDPELERAVRGRLLTHVAIVVAFVSLVLALFSREVIHVVAPGYGSAYRAVGLLLVGIGAYALCSITGAGMSITRKTWWTTVLSGAGAVTNVGLNFVLIPAWGMIGAAASTAAAYALIAFLYYRKGQDLYPTPYQPGKVLGVFAVALPGIALGAVSFPSVPLGLLTKCTYVIAFLVALVVFRIVEPGEARWLRDRVRRLVLHRAAPTSANAG